jgi:hypothetical protein
MESHEFNNHRASSRVLPREEPHAKKKCCGFEFGKCVKFALAKKLNQDEMLEKEMALDTRHL